MRPFLRAALCAASCIAVTTVLAVPAAATSFGGGYSIMLNSGLNSSNGYNGHFGPGTYSDIADNGSRIDLTIGNTGGGFLRYTGNGNTESEGGASMDYTVRVDGNGPLNAFGMVEMRLTSKGFTETTGFYQANAGISLTPNPLHPFDFYLPIAFSFHSTSCSGSSYNCSSGLSGPGGWDVSNYAFYMIPNRDYTLTLSVGLRQSQPDRNSISVGGPGTLRSGTAHAYVDPIISLAPGVTGYNFINNGPPMTTGGVPEPASWAMLITGFGLVGTAARRRRLRPRAAG